MEKDSGSDMSITKTADLELTEEFTEALSLLSAGESVFLTGRAGTGKSTLVREFLARTDRNVVAAAPTGIAALNVGGYTIHRLFGFWPGVTVDSVRSGSYYPGLFASVLKSVDTIIIDEASMIRADLFDCIVEALERFGPQPGMWLGGVQLVLVGDLFQLPPVVTDGEIEYFQSHYPSAYFFDARSFDRFRFTTVELTKVFRQTGDVNLLEILNAVRDGSLLSNTLDKLNEHVVEGFEPPVDEDWLTLTTTNRIANARNRKMLEQLPGPEIVSEAQYTGETEGFDPPTEDRLPLRVGAQVMMLTNEPRGAWVNGTIATVVEVAEETVEGLGGAETEVVATVRVPDGSSYRVTPHSWEIKRPQVEGGSLVYEPVGRFRQLPMRLAWVITIHKSQGQTLKRAVIDVSGGTFADGQLYVALSRLTDSAGLILARPIKPRDLRVSNAVRRFLAEETDVPITQGRAYIGACFVGDAGRMYQPRPVEIAVITDDGQELTTLINPERDLGTARQDFGITASDVQLAPTLAQAWPVLASALDGLTPAGPDIDRTMSYIDFEMKRNGVVAHIPMGDDLDRDLEDEDERLLSAATALDRARAVQKIMEGDQLDAGSGVFLAESSADGFLKPRPSHTADETFLVQVADADSDHVEVLAGLLSARTEAVASSATAASVLAEVNRMAGRSTETNGVKEHHQIGDVLTDGVRVCFSGSAVDPAGNLVSKSELAALAEARGLAVVSSMTKTKCDVLVTAEEGSQSNKAKNAVAWGKPIFTANQFFSWLAGESEVGTPSAFTVDVYIRPVTAGRMVREAADAEQSATIAAHAAEGHAPSEAASAAVAESSAEPVISRDDERDDLIAEDAKPEDGASRFEPTAADTDGQPGTPAQLKRVTPEPQGRETAAALLAAESRVAFVGIAAHPDTGGRLTRADLVELAEDRGLVAVQSVTRTGCDVLVQAAAKPGSLQIEQAERYAVPILAFTDFWEWAQTVPDESQSGGDLDRQATPAEPAAQNLTEASEAPSPPAVSPLAAATPRPPSAPQAPAAPLIGPQPRAPQWETNRQALNETGSTPQTWQNPTAPPPQTYDPSNGARKAAKPAWRLHVIMGVILIGTIIGGFMLTAAAGLIHVAAGAIVLLLSILALPVIIVTWIVLGIRQHRRRTSLR